MANGFDTFDLGRVFQTAEAIKGMRREAETDKIRNAYLNTQMAGQQQAQGIQKQQADQETQTRAARNHYLAAQAVETAADPIAAARELAPEMIAAFEQTHGQGSFERLPPDVVKQIAGMGKQKSAAAAGINLQPSPDLQAQQNFAREMDATNFSQQKQIVGMQREMTPYQQQQLELQRRQLTAKDEPKPPPGYRFKGDGSLEFIPGGPQDPTVAKKAGQQSMSTAYETYKVARDGLLAGLQGSETGPIAGRLPAVTSAQQTAEGGVAAMAPVLKGIFRTAGEGTFTDKDQELLMAMVPTRKDEPEARKAKIQNIDAIIRAKLGIDQPTQGTPTATGPNGQKLKLQNGQWVPAGG